MSILNRVILKKTFVSSTITTTGVDMTDNAYGEFVISNVIVKSDSTGLAGGTNFQVTVNNANGLAVVLAETVANLGANKCVDLSSASVTKQATTLENGKKVTLKATVGNCTGAGTIDVYLVMEKVDQGASVNLV